MNFDLLRQAVRYLDSLEEDSERLKTDETEQPQAVAVIREGVGE